MNTLMVVNSLDNVQIAYIANDTSSYGKFMCVYANHNHLQSFARHLKCGFKTAAEAINWYLNRYPTGTLLTEQNFLEVQNKLLHLKIPTQSATFDPLHMSEKPRPTPAKQTTDGKIVSDFE